jgi:hypothetical protein
MGQLTDHLAFGLRRPHLKRVVECRIGHPHAQVGREDEERVPDRLDNFFRILLGVSQRLRVVLLHRKGGFRVGDAVAEGRQFLVQR